MRHQSGMCNLVEFTSHHPPPQIVLSREGEVPQRRGVDFTNPLAQSTNAPVIYFINVLLANFTYECLFGSFFSLHVTREKLLKRCLHKKFVHKMLMKMTPAQRVLQNQFHPQNCTQLYQPKQINVTRNLNAFHSTLCERSSEIYWQKDC